MIYVKNNWYMKPIHVLPPTHDLLGYGTTPKISIYQTYTCTSANPQPTWLQNYTQNFNISSLYTYFWHPTTHRAAELHPKFQFIKPIHVVLTPHNLSGYGTTLKISIYQAYTRTSGPPEGFFVNFYYFICVII